MCRGFVFHIVAFTSTLNSGECILWDQPHIGAPGYLVTNLVKHLVTNLVIHWILWSIWWQYWWHILWGTKFVTIFGEHSITLFGDSLKLSPYLVTFLSHNLSLNQFTKFFTIYFTNYFPIFRDNSVTISVLTNFSQNNQYICHNNWWFIKLVTQLLTQFNAFGVKIIVIISQCFSPQRQVQWRLL